MATTSVVVSPVKRALLTHWFTPPLTLITVLANSVAAAERDRDVPQRGPHRAEKDRARPAAIGICQFFGFCLAMLTIRAKHHNNRGLLLFKFLFGKYAAVGNIYKFKRGYHRKPQIYQRSIGLRKACCTNKHYQTIKKVFFHCVNFYKAIFFN